MRKDGKKYAEEKETLMVRQEHVMFPIFRGEKNFRSNRTTKNVKAGVNAI